jgi:hypothetical protein
MAEQAAMFGGVVMLMFREQSHRLSEQHEGEQQYMKPPPADMIGSR